MELAFDDAEECFNNIRIAFSGFESSPRWIVWRYDNGSKVPLNKNNRFAEGDQIKHGAPLDEVLERVRKDSKLGPGFIFTSTIQPLMGGVDLDGCRNPDTGEIDDWAKRWISRLNSYTEISPSKTGLKIYLKNVSPVLGNHTLLMSRDNKYHKQPQIEIYSDGRYFAVTGWHLNNTPIVLRENSEAWTALLNTTSPIGKTKSNDSAGINSKIFKMGRQLVDDGATDDTIIDMVNNELNNENSRVHPNAQDKERILKDPFTELHKRGLIKQILKKPRPTFNTSELILDPRNYPQIAEMMINFYWTNIEAQLKLAYWQEEFYLWTSYKYVKVSEEIIKAHIWNYLSVAKIRTKEKTLTEFKPTIAHVSNVVAAIKTQTIVDAPDMPCWRAPKPKDIISAPGSLVACRNGLLDPLTGELFEPTPDYFNIVATDVVYDPDATYPRWMQFLTELWPDDQECINFLQEWFGYMLIPDNSFQKCFLMVAPKRSGKGTINRTLEALIGKDNCCSLASSALSQNFGMQGMIGKLVATVPDARLDKMGAKLLVERVLSISGDDAQNVPRKYKDDWYGRLPTRVMMYSNLAPEFDDPTGTIASRFIAIQRKGEGWYGKEDLNLGKKLIEELSGIMNWAVAGLKRLKLRGEFVQPESGKELISRVEEASAPVLSFIKDRCVKTGQVVCGDLFQAWKSWCSENEIMAGSNITFGSSVLSVVGVEHKRRRVAGKFKWVYVGLALIEEERDEQQNDTYEF